MNKIFLVLSVAAAACLAETKTYGQIGVQTKKPNDNEVQREKIENRATNDLATALSSGLPEVSHKRTTGFGQDIFVRGFGYENVNIEVDGAKVYGGCPNHMDPPLSHIADSEVESLSLTKGPFDVLSFGNMGAKVDVATKEPKEGFGAELQARYGSYEYQNYQAMVNGGTKELKLLGGVSYATQKPYDDGDGKSIVEATSMPTYKNSTDSEALYKVSNYKAKAEFTPNSGVKVKASAVLNKNDQGLYPGKPMDAIKDDTLRLDGSLSLYDIGAFSDALSLSAYKNSVKHDMDNFTFRNMMPDSKALTETESSIFGAKLQNKKSYKSVSVNYGIDAFLRSWEATNLSGATLSTSMKMLDSQSSDVGVFADAKIPISSALLGVGVRADRLNLKNKNQASSAINAIKAVHGSFDNEKDETLLGGYVRVEQFHSNGSKAFVGIGRGAKAPDPIELFIVAQKGAWVGNPNLKPSINNEVDIGYEHRGNGYSISPTIFYSVIEDYVYISKHKNKRSYENIDANIYGIEVSSSFELSKELEMKNAIAYQKGTKKDTPSGISDKDLAEIPPLKLISTLKYDQKVWSATIEAIATASQESIDSDINEQKSKGFGVLNLKADYKPTKNLTINAGIENLLDHTYTVSNGYDRNPLNQTIYSVNEPGRTFFIGASYRF